jgi:hypothetical protein
MKRLLETDDIAATTTVGWVAIFEQAGHPLTKDKVKKLYDSQKELFKDGKLIDHKLFEKTLKNET